MILTVDVGNTNITLGAYEGEALQFISRLATDSSRTDDQYAIELSEVLKLHRVSPEAFESAVIGSVVPERRLWWWVLKRKRACGCFWKIPPS